MISPIIPRFPTPFEGRLIASLLSTASIALGLVAIIVAARASAEKQVIAHELAVQGGWSIAFGLGIWGVRWLVGRWRDYD